MSIAARSLFWVVSFGTLGYGLFTFVKPDDELLQKIDNSSKHTDSRKAAKDTISVLKAAINQESDIKRLSRRDAQRLEKLQKAHKAREEVEATSETEDYFSGAFKIRSENVEQLLTQVPSLEMDILAQHFDIVKREINELQKFVVTSSFFLKEFNMRKYLGIVQNLQTKCYELEDTFVPRKKFGFTRKKLPKSHSQKQHSIDESDSSGKIDSNKWDEKLFGFDSKEDKVLSLENVDLFQRDVALRNLKNCTVSLKGVMGTLHITNLDNCIVLSGPVTSSVFVEKCTNCKIVTACQQLRMHSSLKCDIYLHVTSKGIVEDCLDIRTAPYNLTYDDLDKHFNMSMLDRNSNNWDCLDDFNWLAPDIPSPNWSILDVSQRVTNWDEWWSKTPL
ncbi:putative beta-tubulin cofactor C [Danaus plexippus plexippus]|uniref:Beta-tubulin cofactor C n=1 Tax=Danaus plexippus plexippus TaxID=278856 RepID=A0A212EH44_DANPL|nr:tubulin-specific chaperone C [Danaus plexippus plexippus]OWR40791.1 putative beta-tubulin cofactor C [Danaus plexippus plexippus]